LQKLFSSSFKSSVTDSGYSFSLFSDRMSIIVALWSSYSLHFLLRQARSLPGVKGDCQPVGTSTTHNLIDLHGLLEGWSCYFTVTKKGYSKTGCIFSTICHRTSFRDPAVDPRLKLAFPSVVKTYGRPRHSASG
jgi:hypothetical protein